MYDYLKRITAQYYYVVIILFSLPALYAYNPLPLYFLNDDFIHVPLSQLATWGQRNSIRPFNDLTLYMDYLLWGNNAAGYHFTNLIIHFADAFLVYFLSKQLFLRFTFVSNTSFWGACAALFFWGYAFHSEGVFWVIGRTGPLSTFFFLICLIIFLSNLRKWYFILLSLLCYFSGLLTYESVFILPPTLILLAVTFKDFRNRSNLIFIAAHWGLLIYYLYLRIKWTGELAGNYEGENLNQFNILALAGNYSKLIIRSFIAPQSSTVLFLISALIFSGALVTLFFYQVKKIPVNKPMITLVLIFLLSFLPYISLGIDTHGVEAERYLYLPSVFTCFLIAVFFSFFRTKNAAVFFFLLYLLYNLFYLLKSSNAFVIAGDITNKTMEIIKENKQVQNIYIRNLPGENYGVPIFRLGLEQGVNWQTKNDSFSKKIKIISFNNDDLYHIKNRLEIKQKDTVEFPLPIVFIRNRNPGKENEFDKISGLIFNPQTDMLIDYSESFITVSN